MSEAALTASKGGFSELGEDWRFDGALTLDNAAAVMAATAAMALPPSGRIDLGGLAPADSAALAVLMALRRRAQAEGRALQVENMPGALYSLAVAYGVDELVRGTA